MDIPTIIKSSDPKACLKKKGDLATATEDGKLDTLSVGPDGTIVAADSSQTAGINWVSAQGAGSAVKWGSITGVLNNQTDLGDALNGREPANANIQGHIAATGNPHGTTKADIGLSNVTNETQIPKSVGTTKGSLISFSAAGAPLEVPVGADTQVLTADSSQPSGIAWKNTPGGAPSWGIITGNLSNQSDLQTALNGKAPITSGTSMLKGNGTGGFTSATAGTDYLVPAGNGSQLTGITPSQVGLGKVTNDKQVKATTSTTDGNLVSWSGTTGDTILDSGKKASDFAATTHVHTPGQVGLSNVTNNAQVPLATVTIKGDLITATGNAVVTRLGVGSNGQVLTADNSQPTGIKWATPSGQTWGSLTGTMSNQTDLQNALNGKVSTTTTINGHALSSNVMVTAADVGLGNVSNDAQLKRSSGDINSLPLKSSPVVGDILLGEDSANGYAKIKIPISALPAGGSGPTLSVDGGDASSVYGGVTKIDGGNA